MGETCEFLASYGGIIQNDIQWYLKTQVYGVSLSLKRKCMFTNKQTLH